MNRECLGEGGVEKKGHTQTKKPLEVCQVVCVCVCLWGGGGVGHGGWDNKNSLFAVFSIRAA